MTSSCTPGGLAMLLEFLGLATWTTWVDPGLKVDKVEQACQGCEWTGGRACCCASVVPYHPWYPQGDWKEWVASGRDVGLVLVHSEQ